jgi:hypothetical protein
LIERNVYVTDREARAYVQLVVNKREARRMGLNYWRKKGWWSEIIMTTGDRKVETSGVREISPVNKIPAARFAAQEGSEEDRKIR